MTAAVKLTRLLSAAEVAEVLGCSISTARRIMDRDLKDKLTHVGALVKIERTHLESWIRKNTGQSWSKDLDSRSAREASAGTPGSHSAKEERISSARIAQTRKRRDRKLESLSDVPLIPDTPPRKRRPSANS